MTRLGVSITNDDTVSILEAYKEEYGFSYAKTIDLAVKGLLPQLKPNQGK